MNPVGLLTRVGPLALLATSFVLMAAGLALPGLLPGLVGLGVTLLVLFVLAGPGGVSPWRLLPGIIGWASVTWSNWLMATPHDPTAALTAGMRVAFFAIPGLVLLAFVDPAALGDALAQRLRLPARPVLATVAALERLDDLGQEWTALARARRIRGLGPDRSPVAWLRHLAALTFGLLVGAIGRAGRMTVAMEARGYALLATPGHRRTWARPAPWGAPDSLLLAIGCALAALPFVLAALT